MKATVSRSQRRLAVRWALKPTNGRKGKFWRAVAYYRRYLRRER